MARVKLIFPDKDPLFETKIPLRIGDMNYGNHLGNDRLLALLHEARVQWLHSLKLSELDVGGCGLIMADVMIAYRQEGFYGDVLSVGLFTDAVARSSFDILYKVTTERAGVTVAIADAKTGMAGFDYKNQKISLLPDSLLRIMTG